MSAKQCRLTAFFHDGVMKYGLILYGPGQAELFNYKIFWYVGECLIANNLNFYSAMIFFTELGH